MLGHEVKSLKTRRATARRVFLTAFNPACRKPKIGFRSALRPRPSLGAAAPSPPMCGRCRFEVVPAGTARRGNAMRHTRRRAPCGPFGRLYGSPARCAPRLAVSPPSLPAGGSLARPRRRGKIPLGGSPSPPSLRSVVDPPKGILSV